MVQLGDAPQPPAAEPLDASPRRLTPAQAQAKLEAVLAQAMRSADPLAELRQAAADPSLPAALRRALASADGDGVRLAALLVCKLRFERLIRACAEAEELFNADPEQFAATFRRYHEAVPPTDFFPPREAQRFRLFLAGDTAAPSESAQEGKQRPPVARR